ncbi:MAG: hypothetical protein ACRD4M_15195 [Candidatus Acidiferrales bacterium]
MRAKTSSFMMAFFVAGLLSLPAMAASEKPLGMVIQAQGAQLENAAAAIGATVYPGDALTTDPSGTLRLKVGGGQIYMLSASSMRLAQIDDVVQATITGGTVGFSTTSGDRMQLDTPVGVLSPVPGKSAYGQISFANPKRMIISAYTGDMELNFDGTMHTINAGTTYSVTVEPGPPPQGASGTGTVSALNRHLVMKAVATAIAGVGAYFIYDELSESPSNVSN